tara:strand:- start:11082 stop:11387 length:306 start_codon:yes stop_codon:yes gene_type:complete
MVSCDPESDLPITNKGDRRDEPFRHGVATPPFCILTFHRQQGKRASANCLLLAIFIALSASAQFFDRNRKRQLTQSTNNQQNADPQTTCRSKQVAMGWDRH